MSMGEKTLRFFSEKLGFHSGQTRQVGRPLTLFARRPGFRPEGTRPVLPTLVAVQEWFGANPPGW